MKTSRILTAVLLLSTHAFGSETSSVSEVATHYNNREEIASRFKELDISAQFKIVYGSGTVIIDQPLYGPYAISSDLRSAQRLCHSIGREVTARVRPHSEGFDFPEHDGVVRLGLNENDTSKFNIRISRGKIIDQLECQHSDDYYQNVNQSERGEIKSLSEKTGSDVYSSKASQQ